MTAPAGLPRLLRGAVSGRALSLAEHVAQHGPTPRVDDPERLIELVAAAGLRGCGGAAFPTAVKLDAVRRSRRRAVVVANGAEGEPASGKDRQLLESTPHLVLDGAVLAAQAVGADTAIVCLPVRARRARASVEAALAERDAAERPEADLAVEVVPDRYLAGEETALVNHLNGGGVRPTLVPPRPAERGVARRPTLVDNVETLAHLALLARHGPAWFRSVGTDEEPGSRLLTVSGAVRAPGVVEATARTGLPDLLNAAGGPTTQIAALLVGGYFGSWVPGDAEPGLTLEAASLRRAGATLGSGAIVALPAGSCGLVETARVVGYLADESAGQCGPCVHGLAAIADALHRLASGPGDGHEPARLARWCEQVRGRGACHHPDGAVRLVASALRVFAAEIELHVGGRCSATVAHPVLPVPAPAPQARAA